MIVCAALGMLIELLAYRPSGILPITALITRSGSRLFSKFWILVFGADPVLSRKFIAPATFTSRAGAWSPPPDQVVWSPLLMWGWRSHHRTRTGKTMRAVRVPRDAASLMGINTDRIDHLHLRDRLGWPPAAGVLVGLTNPKIDP